MGSRSGNAGHAIPVSLIEMQPLARTADDAIPHADLDDEELSRFFELSIDMLCIASFDGHFKRLNGVWQQVTGFSIAELTTRPFLDFVHPDDHQRTLDEVAKQQQEGRKVLSFENRYLCKDGSYKWFHWTSQPDNERQLMYAVARDVTEQRRLHELLKTQAAQLERAAQLLGTQLAEVKTDYAQEHTRSHIAAPSSASFIL